MCRVSEYPFNPMRSIPSEQNLYSSESSSIFDECAWLPWPERRESVVEDKDNESCATMQALYDENSFLPWPDTPRNGRALAA
jgi:hypothetical protein